MALIPDNPEHEKTVLTTDGCKLKDLPGWKPHLSNEELNKLGSILAHSQAQFFITAGPMLYQSIVRGEPDFILKMDDWKKKALIDGQGIRISRDMLMKWLKRELDPMNCFILDYSAIRVEGSGLKIEGGNK